MLARRILDGTVTTVEIKDIANKTDRDIVAEIKEQSDNMTFRSPRFNPAGLRKATAFDDQFAIVSTKFDAKFTTNVLATSYFRSDAEMKANMELVDGFGNFDEPRLAEIFDSVPLTAKQWFCVGIISFLPIVLVEIQKAINGFKFGKVVYPKKQAMEKS